jgi:hypothetical protein
MRAGIKDRDVVLADESLALILDDTEEVWQQHSANLIQVTAESACNRCNWCYEHNWCDGYSLCNVFRCVPASTAVCQCGYFRRVLSC